MPVKFTTAIIRSSETLEQRAVLDFIHQQWKSQSIINLTEMESDLGIDRDAILNILEYHSNAGNISLDGLTRETWANGSTFRPKRCVVHMEIEQAVLPMDGSSANSQQSRKVGQDCYEAKNGDEFKAEVTFDSFGDDPHILTISRKSPNDNFWTEVYNNQFETLVAAWNAYDDFILPMKMDADIVVWARHQTFSYHLELDRNIVTIDIDSFSALRDSIWKELEDGKGQWRPHLDESNPDADPKILNFIEDTLMKRWYQHGEEAARWPGLPAKQVDDTEWPNYEEAKAFILSGGSLPLRDFAKMFSYSQTQAKAVLKRIEIELAIQRETESE